MIERSKVATLNPDGDGVRNLRRATYYTIITYSPSEQRDFVCARKQYANSRRSTMKLFPDVIFVSSSVVTSDWKFSDPNPQPWREGTFVGPKLSR